MKEIRRTRYAEIERALAENPIAALLGPRQCGKSTLARQIQQTRESHYFDLESEKDRARLSDPELALSRLDGLIILDEIQKMPVIFEVLRVLADSPNATKKYLILGSASPQLVKGVSESLAGRVGFVDLSGFSLQEVTPSHWRKLWMRGGFPRSYLANNDGASQRWRENFIRTFLERDIPQLGIRIPSETLRRFWMMIAHCHGNLWNGADLARSMSVSEHTIRHYLDILAGTYMLRILPPWFVNIGKRQYKSPKIYIRDSGLYNTLLTLNSLAAMESHPQYGASWEGFALEQVLSVVGAQNIYYWRTHAGAELDLLLIRNGKHFGIEFKSSLSPKMTKSLHIAVDNLNLEKAWVIYPGEHIFPIHEKVDVLPITELTTLPHHLNHR